MYLVWLLIFVVIPTFLIWLFNFNLLWKYKATLFYAIFFALVFSIPWDLYAVKSNIWFYPKEGNLGLQIGTLPLESYFFYALVTLLLASITILIKYRLK